MREEMKWLLRSRKRVSTGVCECSSVCMCECVCVCVCVCARERERERERVNDIYWIFCALFLKLLFMFFPHFLSLLSLLDWPAFTPNIEILTT